MRKTVETASGRSQGNGAAEWQLSPLLGYGFGAVAQVGLGLQERVARLAVLV